MHAACERPASAISKALQELVKPYQKFFLQHLVHPGIFWKFDELVSTNDDCGHF